MTKTREKLVDDRQLSLLELLQQEHVQRAEQTPGRMCVSAKLQAAIKLAIKRAAKSRETIADDMTDLVGTDISVHQINNWTSESHPHRMPAELLPAFCTATGSAEPLRVLAEAAGVFTLPGADALRAEVQKLREDEQKISRERKRRESFLRELEGGLS
jgi:hypothetical protein